MHLYSCLNLSFITQSTYSPAACPVVACPVLSIDPIPIRYFSLQLISHHCDVFMVGFHSSRAPAAEGGNPHRNDHQLWCWLRSVQKSSGRKTWRRWWWQLDGANHHGWIGAATAATGISWWRYVEVILRYDWPVELQIVVKSSKLMLLKRSWEIFLKVPGVPCHS